MQLTIQALMLKVNREEKKQMKLLRVTEAAKQLGVKPSSIRQLERRGLLPAVRDWNGHRRFKDSDISRLQKSLLRGALLSEPRQ